MANSLHLLLCIQAICAVFTSGQRFQTKDQQLIDSLQQYEFVQPKLSDASIDQDNNEEHLVGEKKLLSFRLQGQPIRILLTLNRNLLSPNFFERHVTKHGYEIVNEAPRNCYYHGHIEGHKNASMVAITSCNGIEGIFTLRDKTFTIQPVESLNGEAFHIVFESEHANLPNYECGHNESVYARHTPVENDVSEVKHRTRRDVLSERKYVELIVVNDVTQFKKHGSKTSTRAISAANYADLTYKVQNIRVVLTMIEIWKDVERIANATANSQYLSNFVEYKKENLDTNETTRSDHAVLVTQRRLQDNRYGWAYIATICSPKSASLINDKFGSLSIFGSLVAHELGHSLGLTHITNECSCEDKRLKCLMNKDVSYGPLKWSNCTVESLKKRLQENYATCLFNRPVKHYFPPKCQNALIDDGEECDCGTKEECEQIGNHCCNYTTCKLRTGSECDAGQCCMNCQIKSKGSLCRANVNDCDLPEYCDGKNPICGPDIYVHNGRPCTVGQEKSLCYLGVCHTHTTQCKFHWGEGQSYGFCKWLGGKSYMKCAKKDVLCGKLQCATRKESPKLPSLGRKLIWVTIGDNNCWSIIPSADDPDVGLVETGTMCGENKICWNNTCVNVNEAYQQLECPNNCSGHGICNNLGHCHCEPGYGCPNCSKRCESNGGGSIDSGNDCTCSVSVSTTASKTAETTASTTAKTTASKTAETTPSTTAETTKSRETSATSIPKGNEDETKGSNDVAKIVIPVVVVAFIAIVLVLCYVFRKQIGLKLRNKRRPANVTLEKSENVDKIVYSSRENLADSSTGSKISILNIGDANSGYDTSISFMPESKLDHGDTTGKIPTSLG